MNLRLIFSLGFAFAGVLADVSYNEEKEYKEQRPVEFDNWEQWHMWVEHDLDKNSFTAEAFFQLHTTSDPTRLSSNDILRMYGLSRDEVVGQGNGMGDHDDTELIAPEMREKVLTQVLTTIDSLLNDGQIRKDINLEDWVKFKNLGGELPDFGFVGHEYDFESEYERHHWLDHHAEGDPDIKEWHKEDIEHELLHHFHEIEHGESEGKLYYAEKDLLWKNLPPMFKAL